MTIRKTHKQLKIVCEYLMNIISALPNIQAVNYQFWSTDYLMNVIKHVKIQSFFSASHGS